MKPKDNDDWIVWGIVWCLVVSESGSKKSAAFRAGMRPIADLEKKLLSTHKVNKQQHAALYKYYCEVKKKWEAEAIKAQHEGSADA